MGGRHRRAGHPAGPVFRERGARLRHGALQHGNAGTGQRRRGSEEAAAETEGPGLPERQRGCNDKQVFSQAVEYGEAAKEPNATVIPGFVFVGWDHEFNEVKENLTINAIYEVKQEESKNVLVVLGNWMNNDGTISSTMRKRLELALVANSEFKPSYIVVTGGMANAQAGISEAQAMYNYLVDKGVDPNIIIKEDKSMSTYQNANYTMTKLENIDFKNLIIVSTIEHFVNYQTIKYFNDAALNNSKIKAKGIAIMIYTNNGSY